MKHFKKILLLLLALFLVGSAVSCSSDDDVVDPLDGTYIKFTVNGENYQFDNIFTSVYPFAGTVIAGSDSGVLATGTGTSIELWMEGDISEGSYAVSDDFDSEYLISFTSEALGFDFDDATGGNITITSLTDTYIIGTFSAHVYSYSTGESVDIESGSFKAYLIGTE